MKSRTAYLTFNLPGGGAAAIVKEAGRHAGRLTGGAPRRAPAADGDAVAVEDQRAVGVAACPPSRQRLGNRVRDREDPPHQRLRAGGREPDDAAGLVDLVQVRTRTPLPPDSPSPIGVRAGRQVSAVRASGPHCRGYTTAKAGLDNRSIRPIRPDQQCWYERPARPAGIRPSIRNTSACPAPSRPLSPARAYAVVRRTRRRGGAVRGAAVRAGWGRPPRGVAWACCAR